MLRKYYKFHAQRTMSIKSRFISNLCSNINIFVTFICELSNYSHGFYVLNTFMNISIFRFSLDEETFLSQTIELVMVYNYKRNFLKFFYIRCSMQDFFQHLPYARIPIIEPQVLYPCHFQRRESRRQLHPRGFRSTYWLAPQSPLAISQNAHSHFLYVAVCFIRSLYTRAYVRSTLTGWKVATSLWSLSTKDLRLARQRWSELGVSRSLT